MAGRGVQSLDSQAGGRRAGGNCESEDARRDLYNMDTVFVSAGIF